MGKLDWLIKPASKYADDAARSFLGLFKGGKADDAWKAAGKVFGTPSASDLKVVASGVAGKAAKGPLRKWSGRLGKTGAGLVGAQIALNQFGLPGPFSVLGNFMDLESPGGAAVDPSILSTLGQLERSNPALASEMFQQYLDQQAQARANRPPLPDLVSSYDAQAAAAQSSLNNYLATMGTYAGNQSRAITDAYSRMAGNLQKSADDTFTRGQMTAADLENLYAGLAGQQAAMAAGAGQATPASQTAGLAAPSGAAATAPQTTRTYGRGLADYLGREAGIESGAISRTAQSQALQGAGMAQGLNDYLAMKSADLQFQLANDLAQGRTQAEQQQAMMQYERDMADLEYEAQAAQQMMGFQMEEAKATAAEEQTKYDAAVNAAYIWSNADPEMRKQLAAFLGSTDVTSGDAFVKAVYDNPALLIAIAG